jgi:hypothetical protein
LRKALSEPITLCQSLAVSNTLLINDGTPSDILVSDDSSTLATCKSVVPPTLPTGIPEWKVSREGNGGTGRIAITKSTGQIHTLDYKTEVPDANYSSNKKYSISLQNSNTNGESVSTLVDYAPGDSIYLIEERVYTLDTTDPNNKKLKLRVNGGNEQDLVTGIETFTIAAQIKGATGTFGNIPSATNNEWKKIEGVNVTLQLKKPDSCSSGSINGCRDEDFKTSGSFYPRNVMSK